MSEYVLRLQPSLQFQISKLSFLTFNFYSCVMSVISNKRHRNNLLKLFSLRSAWKITWTVNNFQRVNFPLESGLTSFGFGTYFHNFTIFWFNIWIPQNEEFSISNTGSYTSFQNKVTFLENSKSHILVHYIHTNCSK